jgi:hypothetical protein
VIAAVGGLAAVGVALAAWWFPRHPSYAKEADVGVDHIDALHGNSYAVTLFNRGAAHATHVHAFIDQAGRQTTFDAEHLCEPVLFDSVAAGKRSRTATLQLTGDVPEGTVLSVWTAWRDGERGWLDDPPVESSIDVPAPIRADGSHSSELGESEATLKETQIADAAFYYDPATDTFEWDEEVGRGHASIITRVEAQGRNPATMIAGRVFADAKVRIYSDDSQLTRRQERRLTARARIEGLDLLKARSQ